MNRKIETRFAPPTRFELTPAPTAPFRATEPSTFETLKETLLETTLENAESPELYAPLRRAANEAAALAWLTPFPALFFPALFEEKTRTARLQLDRQNQIRSCDAYELAAA